VIRVLASAAQVAEARANLRAAGLDTSRGWRRAMYALRWRLRFRRAPEPVAVNKSWDVWTMYRTVLEHAPDRAARVFEMGSYNSEIPLALWRAGYRDIRASDFNPLGRAIRWYGNRIDFRCENFYAPDLAPASVDVMTALSVIEHGYDREKLVAAAARLLKPGGLFLFTTDYREEGATVPDTLRPFNLSYRVFSRADIESLVRAAGAAGLELLGAPEWGESEYPVEWQGFRFTFLFVALRKVR
jgi:SAM-dependent methyltransferase